MHVKSYSSCPSLCLVGSASLSTSTENHEQIVLFPFKEFRNKTPQGALRVLKR